MSSVLVQISDPHFGTEQPPVVDALLRFVHDVSPDVVVLSGDITQRARRAQFAAARRFVDQLEAPCVLAVPGNHDIPLFNVAARAFSPYANYCEAFGPNLEPRWSSPDLHVICVNTTRPARRKDGEVSPAQIERVCRELRDSAAEKLRIVVIHQPVHVIREADYTNLLHGHRAAVRAWTDAGVDFIMGGHIHLPYVRQLADGERELPRRVWAVQAGTALSVRIRGAIPNSINVVRYGAGDRESIVERWDFSAETAAFRCVDREKLELDRGLPGDNE